MSQNKDVIEVYQQILNGTRLRFSNCTWHDDNNIKLVVKYLFESQLKWSIDDIKENLNWYILVEYKLAGLLSDTRFKGSPYRLISFVYPNVILPWELKKSPLRTWDEENIKKSVKWLFETKLKWSKEDIRKKLKANTFKKNNLDGLLNFFNGSPYDVLEFVFPNEFKPWELKNIPWKIVNQENYRNSFFEYISEKEDIALSEITLDTISNHCSQFVRKNTKAFQNLMQQAELLMAAAN